MPRGIRFIEKKRGQRRTGSPGAGRLGEAAFYTFFLVLGLVGIAYLAWGVILPEWRANQYAVRSKCRVLDKRVVKQEQLGLERFRPEFKVKFLVQGEWKKAPSWTYDAANEYRFDQADAESILEHFSVGLEYPCWYDSRNVRNPSFVVLVRYSWWPWIVLAIAASFAVFGGSGLSYSFLHGRSSEERRLSRAAEANKRQESSRRKKKGKPGFPTVPPVANIINSPGTVLEHRLPITSAPGWQLFGIGMAALLWNAIVILLLVQVVGGFMDGEPSWFLAVFLIPFIVAGAWLATQWIRQLMLTAGVGTTRIEIEEHPFRPGGTYDINIAQFGRLKMNHLEIFLVCDERASFHQGTDTRYDRQRVYEDRVYEHGIFEVQPSVTFEDQFKLAIPAEAMHSLITAHNEVAWALVVRCDIAHWPDYERRFAICVYPPEISVESPVLNSA